MSLARALYSLGQCKRNMFEHAVAFEYFQRALQTQERVRINEKIDKGLATI